MTTDCGDIFLGSGASITFVPENDIYFPSTNGGSAFDGVTSLTEITAASSFSNVFSLVNNLYVGCIIERYGVGSNTYTDEVTTVTFNSDTKTDYSADYLVFTILPSDGGAASTHAFWFDDTGAISEPSHGADASSSVDISNAGVITKEEFAALFTTAVNAVSNISATRSGNVVTVTNTYGGNNSAATTTSDSTNLSLVRTVAGNESATPASFQDCARITSNTDTTITFSPALTPASGDYFVITQYGAPVPAPTDTAKRLLSDEWLGLVESITFPTTEVEMKQVNLALGGSRNWTYQYKGIETASGGSINLVSNHAAWLYYFFGRCTGVSATTSVEATTDNFTAASSGATYIDYGSVTETGPIFYRSVGDKLCPPIAKHLDNYANMDKLTLPIIASGEIDNEITYTFAEQNGELLPSFSLEQVFSKLPSSDTYRTTTTTYEDTNFVTIARGNRVNTMTITANENEEIKMTMDLSTRTIHNLESDEVYDARRGVTDETAFFNYDSESKFREPFFFSSGYLKVFGVQFLKINSITLTMNNSLTERRFIGVGNKSIQEAIPAQRTYELQFTGHVTDDRLYQELLNQDENTSETDGQMVELNFSKANGESFTLKFKDYMVSANNFPLPDDKGPVVVETTIMPRNLESCSVTTHWILQG